MQTCRDGHAEEENQEKVEELNRRWMHTRWIFSEKEFEDLCQKTKEISLRSAERIFVKSFHNIQLLSDEEVEFPSLDTVEEMLDWVHRWRNIFMKRVLAHHRKMISVLLQRLSSMWMDISGRIFALKTWQNG